MSSQPGYDLRHPLISLTASLAIVLLYVGPGAAADVPANSKSIFWEPYAVDEQTAGLFHFDGAKRVSVDSLLNGEESQHEPLAPAAGGAGPADRAAVNAVPLGPALSLSGACSHAAAKGRFGDGLHIAGGQAMVCGELPTGPRTLELWLQVRALPAELATLVYVAPPTASVRPIALRLGRDGSLEVEWAGKTQQVTGAVLRAGQWTHLALAWDGASRAELRVDGKRAATKEPLPPAGTAGLRRFVLGNDPDARSGADVVVDEVRCSRTVRDFYPCDLDWTDPAGKAEAPAGQPYFRDAADLWLCIGFDGTLTPAVAPAETASPASDARAAAEASFLDGVHGRAVVLSKAAPALEYRGKDLLSAERGTVAMWLRPLNWNNGVTWNPFAKYPLKTVPVFEVLGGGKNRPERLVSLSLYQTPIADVWSRPVDIHPGRWMHLCWTWDGSREQCYLDGQPWPHPGAWRWERKPAGGGPSTAATAPAGPAKAAGGTMALRFGRDDPACALDDFRVYSRALAPAEVSNLAALFDRRAQIRPLPAMELAVDYNGVLGHVDVRAWPLSPRYAEVRTALVTVGRKGAAETIGQGELTFADGREAAGRVQTKPMEFATYEVRAAARDQAGREVCTAAMPFERKAPPWWHNRLGVSDRVMPGWTPVAVRGREVAVSLRQIHFGESGLPERIVSANGDVLAGPIALEVGSASGPVAMAPTAGAFAAQATGEIRADIKGSSASADMTADVSGYVEFDGMMWFRVTLSPRGGKDPELRAMSVRIPYAGDASSLMHWWSGNHGFRDGRVVHIGATPQGQGRVFSSNDKARVSLFPKMRGSFIPYVMLTGDRRGMAWFAENDSGWTQGGDAPAVVVERTGQAVSLVLNVVAEPVKLDGPRTFEFGLQPIPVKPLEAGWRMTPNWGVFPDSFCGFNLKGGAGTDFYRHPQDMDWTQAERRLRGEFGSLGGAQREPEFVQSFRRNYGRDPRPRETMVAGLYHDLSGIGGFPDHTREWGETWWIQRYTPDIIDYCVWIWDEWVRRGLAKGIYFDNCFNYPMEHWPSPVTYKRADGTVQPGFQWRQIREQMKRIRQVSHDRGLVPHLCAHTTHTLFVPYHAFFDTILDGEDFYQAPGEVRDFMDSWPPDRLRFMNGRKWGLIPTWLGWYGGSGGNWPAHKTLFWQHWRAYTAALLAHDIVWTCEGLGLHSELDADWLRESRLKLDPNTEFVPYWDLGGLAKHDHGELYVCAWKRPGLCAVAVVNWSRRRIEAKVNLAAAAMGFGATPPDGLAVRDVDNSLLMYFDDDVTKLAKPTAAKAAGLDSTDSPAGEGLGLTEKPTLAQRRAQDPDGQFTWKAGVLTCPVRGHDFRIFELRPAAVAGTGRQP